MYVPVKDLFAINLKAVRMRTWLWTWHEPRDRTFEGGVIEFVMPSPHGGPKLGIGSFTDVGSRTAGGIRSRTYSSELACS
jgi:hypothetical protein